MVSLRQIEGIYDLSLCHHLSPLWMQWLDPTLPNAAELRKSLLAFSHSLTPTFIIELLPIKYNYNHERASRPTYPLLGQANYGLENDILWLSHSPSYLRKHPGGCRDTVMRLAMSSPPGPMWRIASRLSWHRQTRKSCITCFSWLLILLMSRLLLAKHSKTKLFQENRQSFGRTWCFVFVAFSLG
jgi:hypothetical protein